METKLTGYNLSGGGDDQTAAIIVIQAVRNELFSEEDTINTVRTIMNNYVPQETLSDVNDSILRLKSRIRSIDDEIGDGDLTELTPITFNTGIKYVLTYCENVINNLEVVSSTLGERLRACEAATKTAVATKTTPVDTTNDKLEILQQQIFDLQNLLTVTSKQNAVLDEQIQQLTDQYTRLQTDYQQLSENSINLQQQFSQASGSNVQLQAFVASLQQDGQLCVQQLIERNNQLQQEQRTFNQVLTAGREQLRDLRSTNSSLQMTLKRLQNNLNILNTKQPPPMPKLSDSAFQARLSKLDSSIATASRNRIYKVQQFFPQIQADPNGQIWRAMYSMLMFILDIDDTNYTVESVQKLLILVEGGMRGYSDTSISAAIEHINTRVANGQFSFRDPLIYYNNVVNTNLQSLINLNLSTLYRRQNGLYDKLASNRVFSRHVPIPALNTFSSDRNFSKSSIYVYDDEVLKAIDSVKK